MGQNNVMLVGQHFSSNCHDFNRKANLKIIQKTEKNINIKEQKKKQTTNV